MPSLLSLQLLSLILLSLQSLTCFELTDFGLVMLVRRVQFHVDVEILLVDGCLHSLDDSMKFDLMKFVPLDCTLQLVDGIMGPLQVVVCRGVRVRQGPQVLSLNLLLIHLLLNENILRLGHYLGSLFGQSIRIVLFECFGVISLSLMQEVFLLLYSPFYLEKYSLVAAELLQLGCTLSGSLLGYR